MNIPDFFSSVQDFRVQGRCLHDLGEILGLILLGVICDCDDFSEIFDYGEVHIEFLREEFGFEFLNGIPSEDTLSRVLGNIVPGELEASYQRVLGEIKLANKQLCIDSKELRGTIPPGRKHSLVRMVNVWVEQDGLSFGQLGIEEKSNELTAIPVILSNLDCKGSLVSLDAMGCQKNIVRIIRDKQADYLIGVKKNQKDLYHQLSEYMLANQATLPFFQKADKAHNRLDIRKVYVSKCPEILDVQQQWKDLSTLVMVQRTRVLKTKTETNLAFYISSLKTDQPEVFANYIRKHWAVENLLHWQLDVTFAEDQSMVRTKNAPINLHLVRKWTLHLLKKHPDKISIKRKRKKANGDNQYLKTIIFE